MREAKIFWLEKEVNSFDCLVIYHYYRFLIGVEIENERILKIKFCVVGKKMVERQYRLGGGY